MSLSSSRSKSEVLESVQLLHAHVAAGVPRAAVSIANGPIAIVGPVDGAVSVALVVNLGMHGVSQLLHHSVEAVVIIGSVLHYPSGAIGFLEGVAALDLVAIPGLPLALVVSGMRILDAVVEVVLRIVVGLVLIIAIAIACICLAGITVSVDSSIGTDHIVVVSISVALMDRLLVLDHRAVTGRMSSMRGRHTGTH